MTNGENKTRLVEILCDVLSSNRLKTFRVLKCQTVFFSKENVTIRFNEVEVCQFAPLSSNQEEADTKVVLHCHHALTTSDKNRPAFTIWRYGHFHFSLESD